MAVLLGQTEAPRCQQMLMGEGKTTVIAPLLVLLLADANRCHAVPKPQLQTTVVWPQVGVFLHAISFAGHVRSTAG